MIDLVLFRRAYDNLLPLMGRDPEPFESIVAAEMHRDFCRPENPRVILIAESHVHTPRHELRAMRGCTQFGFDGIPEEDDGRSSTPYGPGTEFLSEMQEELARLYHQKEYRTRLNVWAPDLSFRSISPLGAWDFFLMERLYLPEGNSHEQEIMK